MRRVFVGHRRGSRHVRYRLEDRHVGMDARIREVASRRVNGEARPYHPKCLDLRDPSPPTVSELDRRAHRSQHNAARRVELAADAVVAGRRFQPEPNAEVTVAVRHGVQQPGAADDHDVAETRGGLRMHPKVVVFDRLSARRKWHRDCDVEPIGDAVLDARRDGVNPVVERQMGRRRNFRRRIGVANVEPISGHEPVLKP